ncbi:MAG: homocysteine S-methyltransferase family protein [Anaerolineales bacterium]
MADFRQALREREVLIADGAMGTALQWAGLPAGAAPERWNLKRPKAIRKLHRGYVEAGADLILTNTFGGNRYRLARDGLAERAHEINVAATALAREAADDAGRMVFVVGDIGPTGQMLAPLGALSYDDAAAAFAAQADALMAGGVDALLIETMSDLNEVKAAIAGARQVAEDVPLLATMSFDTKGRTMMGVKPEQAATTLAALPVDVIGANCGRTLDETLTAIRKMRAALPDAILMAKPNAGLPRTEGGDLIYDVTPAVMAEYARRFVAEAGVKIFGGCCGSTAEHIRAVAAALKG